MIAQACGLVSSSPALNENAPIAGSAGKSQGGTSSGGTSSGGTSSGGSTLQLGGSPTVMLPEPCPVMDAPFADQVVIEIGPQRVFYSWTTDEQASELRAGGELFSRTERPGMGRGLLFTELAALGEVGTNPINELANELASGTFAKARFAWTNPWATVMGFPGEDYGNQLLRIELKNEAWIAYFSNGDLRVFDLENNEVPLQTALENPGRIGAIYYESRAEAGGGGYCGTFSQGGVGFREFALGNLDMVKRWSLATPEIADRLASDIAELESFRQLLNCFGDLSDWTTRVACIWDRGYASADAAANYTFALGLPSELYRPTDANVEAIIAVLEASMPNGDPLDVTPGQ